MMSKIYQSKLSKHIEHFHQDLSILNEDLNSKNVQIKELEKSYQECFSITVDDLSNVHKLNKILQSILKIYNEKVELSDKISQLVEKCHKSCTDDSSFILKYYSSRGLLSKMVPDIYSLNDYLNEKESTVCICKDISYGSMVECIEPDCKIRLFHARCVNIDPEDAFGFLCHFCRHDREKTLE